MPFFTHDGIIFHYLEKGNGTPFFFQHGLTGDAEGVCALIGTVQGCRLISFDCRAHGKTTPVGDTKKIGFNAFADDLVSLMDHLGIAKAIIGGTSMGAGVALNCALRHSGRVAALILLRPAWLDAPNAENVRVFSMIADLLKKHGTTSGLEVFRKTSIYASIVEVSQDSANSLLSQFGNPRALEAIARLERIPSDAPNWDRREWLSIRVPTLVLANRQDPIHPFEFGETLAKQIRGAVFKEVTPKSINLQKYTLELREFIADFLRRFTE